MAIAQISIPFLYHLESVSEIALKFDEVGPDLLFFGFWLWFWFWFWFWLWLWFWFWFRFRFRFRFRTNGPFR